MEIMLILLFIGDAILSNKWKFCYILNELFIKVVETCLFFGLDNLYNFSTCTWARLFFKREASLSLFERILRKNVLVQYQFCIRWFFSLMVYRPFKNYLYETWSSESFLLFVSKYFVYVLYHQFYLTF